MVSLVQSLSRIRLFATLQTIYTLFPQTVTEWTAYSQSEKKATAVPLALFNNTYFSSLTSTNQLILSNLNDSLQPQEL